MADNDIGYLYFDPQNGGKPNRPLLKAIFSLPRSQKSEGRRGQEHLDGDHD
jgi:hypothetical protein